jgi:hypothetical protein
MTTLPANPRAPGQVEREIRAGALAQDADAQTLITRLRSSSPAQIDAYIDENVTSLPEVRRHLKALSKAIALLVVEK